MKGNTRVLRASKYIAKCFQIVTDKIICGIISTNYLDLATVVLWKSTSYLTASLRILRTFFPTFHFFVSFFSLLFFRFFSFCSILPLLSIHLGQACASLYCFCWFSDAWVELSPPQRIPLGVPIKIAVMENRKRAGDDGKREKAGTSLLSFPFPSCLARFLFLPSLPTTKRGPLYREESGWTRTGVA